MKIFMHWDMEGVSGLFTREHAWFWEPETNPRIAEEGRQLLVADINSAVKAALDTGVDELIVCDTHHGGGNIRLEEMFQDRRVTYLPKARGANNRWMPGLEGCDGLLLPGHHAMAGTPNAFMPHTQNLEWADFRANGQSGGEMWIEACYAGYFNVPPIMMAGDEAACREAQEQFPGIVTAPVKRAVSRDLATGLDAAAGRRLTAEKIAEAIAKVRKQPFSPVKPKLPMTVTVRMRTPEGAAAAAKKPTIRRLDEHTVEYTVERQCDVVKHIASAGLD